MNTMSFFLWLVPVIFMIHEFEEIFMIEAWYGGRIRKRSAEFGPKKAFRIGSCRSKLNRLHCNWHILRIYYSAPDMFVMCNLPKLLCLVWFYCRGCLTFAVSSFERFYQV